MRHLWTVPFLMLGVGQPPYQHPKAGGPVLVLLDEETEPLFPFLTNASGEAGTIAREDADVFSGLEAVRVTPMQKYMAHLPGWTFPVAENPQAGEYRFVRFAWKKRGGTGVMVQLHDANKQGWGLRYYAGHNVMGWGSKSVAAAMPDKWQVVTRDLFKDFGAVRVTGIALTPMDGEAGLFDHVLLGRTVADLDKATDEALGTAPRSLTGRERDALWSDLQGADRPKAATALRAFLASAPDQVAYIRDRLQAPAPERIGRLIADLNSDTFLVRQKATNELIAIGVPGLAAVRQAAGSDSPEVRQRAELILERLGGPGYPARVVRVLARAATPEARDLLARLAAGEFGAEYAASAKTAMAP